jgi:hypothetical protein
MIDTREGWLVQASNYMRPIFRAASMEIPARVRMSVSIMPKKVRGICYSPEASSDGSTELLIRISEDDPIEVLGVLGHELVHSAVGTSAGHKAPFVRGVRALGLDGKATATIPGPRFRELMDPIVAKLGPFPHAALNYLGARTGPKKQGTRMLKASCEECGYTVRLTRKWLDVGPPGCPNHGAMVAEDAGEEEEGEGEG